MKKILTLVATFALLTGGFTAMAKTVTVTTSTELSNALNGVGNTYGSTDTIFVDPAGGENDVLTYNNTSCPWMAGRIYVIGATDYQPKINFRHQAQYYTDQGTDFSLFFENLSIRYTSGNSATSGQIFYFNKMYTEMDSLVFRNCEFTDYPRTVIRFVPPEAEGADTLIYTSGYYDGGFINYFEMSGCTVHDANVISGNNWGVIYFGSAPYEVVFRDNTFYDLPYMKQIFVMNYVDDLTGRADGEFTFENNTVMVGSGGTYTVFDIGSYMGIGSSFNINNNLFLTPDYTTTDLNGNVLGTEDNPYTTGKLLSVSYGLVTAAGNVIEGYQPWSSGNLKDEEGDYTWLVADTTDNYTMEDVGLAWDDFFDRENKDFSLLTSYPVYTAGVDGSFIGAESWYVDEFPVRATVNVSVNGSSSATVTISPEKNIYFIGDTITLSVELHAGLSTFKDWSDGVTEMTRTIVVDGDVNLVANVIAADYELIWDFDVITKNNQGLTVPMAADHAASAENPGSFGVMTVEHSKDGVTYADTLACDSRNNKAYPYNDEGEVTFVAALIRTTLDSVAVDAAVLAETSMTSEELADLAGTEEEIYAHLDAAEVCPNPDYPYITFSTKGMSGITVSSVIVSEARNFATTNLQWSVDNVNYETVASISIDSLGGYWRDLGATLPNGADDQEIVYVRWMGDPNSQIIGPGMSGTTDAHNRRYNTYFFVGNIKVVAEEGGAAVEEIEAALPVAFSIAQSGNQVTVNGADAATVELFAANGALVASAPVVDGQATLTIPGRGVYYVRAGKEAKAVIF